MPKITTKMKNRFGNARGGKESKYNERHSSRDYGIFFEDKGVGLPKPKGKSEPRYAIGYEFAAKTYKRSEESGGEQIDIGDKWKVISVIRNKARGYKYQCACSNGCCEQIFSEMEIRYRFVNKLHMIGNDPSPNGMAMAFEAI